MDVSDIFFLLGGGERESEEPREGGTIFIENPRRVGGFSRRGRGRGGREAGRVFAGNFGGVGGENIFFGAESPTELHSNRLLKQASEKHVSTSQQNLWTPGRAL